MIWICVTLFFSIILTYVIGFGLGTLLLPLFCMVYPPVEALTLAALVHGLQSFFKTVFNFRAIPWKWVGWFSISAFPASLIGSYVIIHINQLSYKYPFQLFEKTFELVPIRMVFAVMMICFTLFEIYKTTVKINPTHYLFIKSGAWSGFFGGLTGHQGALRTLFTAKVFNNTAALIAFNGSVSCIVDLSRLVHYHYAFNKALLFSKASIALFITSLIAVMVGQQFMLKIKLAIIKPLLYGFVIIFAILFGLGLV
jgi:uncharacterized membrane protein YfcA